MHDSPNWERLTYFSFTCFHTSKFIHSFIRSLILIFQDKPDAIKTTDLEVVKERSQTENCTIFKLPAPTNRDCQHSHHIYAYDISKRLIEKYENKLSAHIKICNKEELFEKIKFAKANAVWMGETSDEMTEFVPVKSTIKGI